MSGAQRRRKPQGKSRKPVGTRASARRRPPSKRRPSKRRPKGRLWRLKRAVRQHPYLFKGLRFTFLAAIWGAIVLGGAVVYFISQIPDPVLATLDDRPPNVTVLAADGTVLAERGLRRGHIRVDVLPDHLIKAVVATEDRRFYHHLGIDPVGLVRAVYRNLTAGAVVQGGSTITQQLAKNLFLKPDRTITRKLEELIYAVWLEQSFSKDEILELYLNRVYFGGGTYGVEAAARHYFGRSARDVTLAHSAMLAGLLKAPSRYAPTRSIRAASVRTQVVLDNMVEAGFLTEAEARKAGAQPLKLRAKGDDTGYPYAVDWVAELLPEYIGEHDGALIVNTTIDAKLQRVAQERLRKLLDTEGRKLHAGQGAVVVLEPSSGAVRALVGGRSYKASPFDRALKALRQPGSAFKPFVYLAALESGFTPNSIAYDGPVNVGGWRPKNYKNAYRGRVTLRYSLAHSLNTVAVKLTAEIGPRRIVDTAHRLGISSTLHAQPSIALGTAEVTLLELAGAYAPFANGGKRVLPHVITRIRNSDSKTLYRRRKSVTGQVVALHNVGAMNDMLSAAVVRGTGKRAAIPGHMAAGKTGTTQNSRDAWFVGYTAHYVAGVWVGNDDGTHMKQVTGGTLPASLWHDIMLAAHRGKKPLALPGAHSPRPDQETIAVGLPWSSRSAKSKSNAQGRPFYQRVFGFFGGG
jgi:penicillin-binding protein 1A